MKTRRVVRSEQWWGHKVPPLVAVASVAISLRPGPARPGAVLELLALLASVAGVAAFGHLVNDWCDIEADARGGKANPMAGLSPMARVALVTAALALGLAPWAVLPRRPLALVALAIEIALLVAYSAPPFRLKARGWSGAIADAGYAYGVPFVLVASALGPRPGPARSPVLLVALGLFGLLVGLRGILWHQVGDAEADRAAGVGTVGRRLGAASVEHLVSAVVLPAELVALVAVVAMVDRPWLWCAVAAFVVWRSFQVTLLWAEPLVVSSLKEPRRRIEVVGFEFVNEAIERWLPLLALVAVAWTSPWWWLVVASHVLVFPNALRQFLGHDIWVLPDAMERLAFARRANAQVADVARQRRQRAGEGAVPLADRAARRWVFVVCGPSSHLHTLHTALRHLRPLTEAEIWVVTDPTRNAEAIDVPGVDQVVDVVAPCELDDHQASIWLKTSIHRHIPLGEWCYLDSDIIAVAPGAEEVFDQRRGPVAFASDVTIRENSVDRFSPWAMTCPCLGYDDQHSCTHLREEIERRFSVAVPGEWLHWNGGVFVFGPEAGPVLDVWHERAVASFAWPEWKTRDQGALIATVWSLGLQDLPRLSPTFNFIADLGNLDLCLDPERGWAHHPSGPWYRARLLHLYTSPLEDPGWELGSDVEAVVLKRSGVRIYRYRRAALSHRVKLWAMRVRRLPRRLTPARITRGISTRLRRAPAAETPEEPRRTGEPVR